MSFKVGSSFNVGPVSYSVELEPDSSSSSEWYKILTAEIVAPNIHVFYSKPDSLMTIEVKGEHELSLTYKADFVTLTVTESALEEIKNGCLVRIWKEIRTETPLNDEARDYIEQMLEALEALVKAKI